MPEHRPRLVAAIRSATDRIQHLLPARRRPRTGRRPPRSGRRRRSAPPGSVLTAMIVSAVRIPARCCTAPEIPNARYTRGLTVLPDCPTWRALGIQPASTSGRDTLSVAPSRRPAPRSAGSRPCPRPRPIETERAPWRCRRRRPAPLRTPRARSAATPSRPTCHGPRGRRVRAARRPAGLAGRSINSVRSLPGNSSSASSLSP